MLGTITGRLNMQASHVQLVAYPIVQSTVLYSAIVKHSMVGPGAWFNKQVCIFWIFLHFRGAYIFLLWSLTK